MKRISKKFLEESYYITNLNLCTVRLVNNSKFPWIILIPNRKKITDITELKPKDQLLLMKEIVFCSKIMKKIFKTSKLNVEKIGNIVPQLHVHIIARSIKDSSWPLSVWVVKEKPYSKKLLLSLIKKLRKLF